jgi:hypothetical protein
VFGLLLVAAGILGFFYEASFTTGDDTPRDDLFGLFDVNGWHNIVHLASGLLGLMASGNYASARLFALGFGAVYTVVAIVGFLMGDGEVILGLLPVNTEDNVLHLLIALAGIGAGMASPSAPPPTTVAA